MRNRDVVIMVGDCEKPKGFSRVEIFRKDIFSTKGFRKGLFVDADNLNLTSLDIKWICENSKFPTLILVRNREKLKSISPNIKVIEKREWGKSFDIFECLNIILKERDRTKVLNYLNEVRPPALLLFNWLISNIDQIGNIPLLMYLDEHILNKKSVEWFYEFLALGIKPVSKYIRYKYRIRKV